MLTSSDLGRPVPELREQMASVGPTETFSLMSSIHRMCDTGCEGEVPQLLARLELSQADKHLTAPPTGS